MKNRRKYLKMRKKRFRWQQIGMLSSETCSECEQNTLIQIYKYDARACITCNEWRDEACNDPKCPFCSTRPKTPYEAYWEMDTERGSALWRKNWRCLNYQHKKDGERKHADKIKLRESYTQDLPEDKF